MMAVLEMVDRPGKPLFHVEHFIEGSYVKYNSNSGFVENTVSRQTPHAFSHFTFERSGHELIVVDVQGVGDLYTDPQIHTADGEINIWSFPKSFFSVKLLQFFRESRVTRPCNWSL